MSGHFIYSGRVGGAEHMAYNLALGLGAAGAKLTFVCGNLANLSKHFLTEAAAAGIEVTESGGGGSRFLAEQRACLDSRLRADATLFTNYFLPVFRPRRLGPAAVVIHDFQYRHFPQHFSPLKRAWLRLSHRRAFVEADTVIVISEHVRRDAIRLFGSKAERARVIPNPISWARFGPADQPHPFAGRPYLLSVAAQYPHKGLDHLVRAFARIAERRADLTLVLVGQLPEQIVSVGADATNLRALIAQLGLADRVRATGYLDDHRLGTLYRHANAFAFPSIFEGFGMPAVEAIGFGVPTLTTRCTALPETTLGLAELADDARDPDEWAERLDRLIDAPRLPAADVERVRRLYDPVVIAGRYLDALAEAGGSSAPVRLGGVSAGS